MIPIHWNNSGVIDSSLPKIIVCFVFPFAFMLLNIFTHIVHNNVPKRKSISKSIQSIFNWLIPIIANIVMMLSFSTALEANLLILILNVLGLGLLLIIIGNYLPKSRQNYTVGIKFPWTLDNADNWNKTHRFASRLYIFSGFLVLLYSIFIINTPQYYSLVIITTIILLPIIYSFILYKKALR